MRQPIATAYPRQLPATQSSSLEQLFPQSPQLRGSLFLFTQAPLHTDNPLLQLVVS